MPSKLQAESLEDAVASMKRLAQLCDESPERPASLKEIRLISQAVALIGQEVADLKAQIASGHDCM